MAVVIPLVFLGGVAAFLLCRCTWWWPCWPADVPAFLMLHSVASEIVDPTCPNNTIRPDELERLIVRLKRRGYAFRTFSEAVANPGVRSVVLTFDDGYVDNYETLLPILIRQQVPATCFVTSRGESDARFLSPAQIKAMAESGLVEIGGHTASHSVLDRIPPEEARREIVENKLWLEKIVGKNVTAFAYPCGGENDTVVQLVRDAGYLCAAAMVKKMLPPATDAYRIHRQIIPRGLKTWQAYLLATRGKWKI